MEPNPEEPEGDKSTVATDKTDQKPNPQPPEGDCNSEDKNAEDEIEEPNPELERENKGEEKSEEPIPELEGDSNSEDKLEDTITESEGERNSEKKAEEDQSQEEKSEEPIIEPEGDSNSEEKAEEDPKPEEKSEEPIIEPEGDSNSEEKEKSEETITDSEEDSNSEEKTDDPKPEEKSEEAIPGPEGDSNSEEKSEETVTDLEGDSDSEEKSEETVTDSNSEEEKAGDPNPEEKKTEEKSPEPEGGGKSEEKTEEKSPELDPEGDKYAQAKIEEPNLRLPKALLKPDGDPNDDLCYMRIFEEDGRRSKHLAEAVAAGAQACRKVYRIRNKELIKVLGPDDEGMKLIHRVSKATIGILADAESNEHRQSYMDLVGTVEEVSLAEELILDACLETYEDMVFPIILMPPTVHHHQMSVPFFKLLPLIGVRRRNILRMEMISGAWIKIDVSKSPPGGSEIDRVVDIYGPRQNVIRAVLNVQSVILEPWEFDEVEKKLKQEFQYEEPEIIDGQFKTRHIKKSASTSFSTAETKGPEKEGEEAAGGSSRTQKDEKQKDVDETEKGKSVDDETGKGKSVDESGKGKSVDETEKGKSVDESGKGKSVDDESGKGKSVTGD